MKKNLNLNLSKRSHRKQKGVQLETRMEEVRRRRTCWTHSAMVMSHS